jgi:hypothetical protein
MIHLCGAEKLLKLHFPGKFTLRRRQESSPAGQLLDYFISPMRKASRPWPAFT